MTLLAEKPAVATETETIVRVYCTGIRKDGRICNRVLAMVQLSRWEEDMASEAQLCCECGKRYTLADYR